MKWYILDSFFPVNDFTEKPLSSQKGVLHGW